MIKESLAEAGLNHLAVFALVIFVAVFVAIAFWAFSRGRGEVATWSSLPLSDDYEPVQPRLPIVSRDESGGCGKCMDCSRKAPEAVSGVAVH